MRRRCAAEAALGGLKKCSLVNTFQRRQGRCICENSVRRAEEAARIATRELFAYAGTTSGRTARKGTAHGYDDHSRRHQGELEQWFTAMVVDRYEAIRREVIQEVYPKKG